MLPKPVKAPPSPRARIKTRRPTGTKRREAKAAGGVDQFTWSAICAFYEDEHGITRCAYGCGRPATVQDHIIPLAKGQEAGGVHRPWNVVPADEICNNFKGQQIWKVANPHPWMRKELSA